MSNIAKIIIAAIAIMIIVGGGVFGFMYLKTDAAVQVAEARAELTAYREKYEPLGDIFTGFTVATEMPYGKQIAAEDLIPADITETAAMNAVLDETELIGKYYRVNVTAGTILSEDLIMEFPQNSDERAYDVITSFNPIGLKANDFVDIRINLPMGEDYIAISHKRVEGVYGGVLKLIMSEYDIAVYNSLVVDNILFKGSTIYATKYVEPGGQTAAEEFYPVSPSVWEIMRKDPNIAQNVDYKIMAERRSQLEAAYGAVDENELLKALLEAGKKIIPDKIINGESVYQTELALEEQRRLEEQLYGGN